MYGVVGVLAWALGACGARPEAAAPVEPPPVPTAAAPRPAPKVQSLALTTRRGDWTAQFLLHPDGRAEGAHVSGGFVHQEESALAAEPVARAFAAAEAALAAGHCYATEDATDERVWLKISLEGGEIRVCGWPSGGRPAEPAVLTLVEQLEALRIGGW